jgi:hypothetical protein
MKMRFILLIFYGEEDRTELLTGRFIVGGISVLLFLSIDMKSSKA